MAIDGGPAAAMAIVNNTIAMAAAGPPPIAMITQTMFSVPLSRYP
jgi:hypothetical protein